MRHALTGAAETLLRYAVWLAISIIGVVDILLLRINLIDLMFDLRVSGWALPAIEKWAFVVLAVAWLGVAVWLEDYLTHAKTTALFWRRSAKAGAVVGGVLLVTGLLYVFR